MSVWVDLSISAEGLTVLLPGLAPGLRTDRLTWKPGLGLRTCARLDFNYSMLQGTSGIPNLVKDFFKERWGADGHELVDRVEAGWPCLMMHLGQVSRFRTRARMATACRWAFGRCVSHIEPCDIDACMSLGGGDQGA
jgi:hypothetical protein